MLENRIFLSLVHQTKRIIKAIQYRLKKIFLLNLYKKISYSQCGEDLLIQYIFDGLKISNPTYLDIGAYDPYRFSNTAIFYKQNSRGVNIEPDPIRFENLAKARKNDINLNIGISDFEGELDFYVMSESTLSSFSEETANNLQNQGYLVVDKKKVRVSTINEVLKSYCNDKFPDFLSIDVEGLDERIIKSIDYTKSTPIVICIETISFSNDGRGVKNKEIISFLESKGYMVFADTNVNTIFVKREVWMRY